MGGRQVKSVISDSEQHILRFLQNYWVESVITKMKDSFERRADI